MTKRLPVLLLVLVALPLLLGAQGGGCESKEVQSVSGTKMVKTEGVKTGPDGKTIEQHNVAARIAMDNQPGSIKHLYVISAYSGQVLIYSTVKGKVTSSGKRLTPERVEGGQSNSFVLDIGGATYYTNEVLGEDGTFGRSIEYLYWWDTKGVYHQHYKDGGQIIHVSDQPIAVKNVVLNMELSVNPN